MNVLVCPDKFKGTLDALAAARAIARGWRSVRPGDHLELLPISDGGDGFGSLLGQRLQLEARRIRTVDAAHRPCSTPWWRSRDGSIAIVESARAIGLAMLPPGKFHPFELDTFGLGKVLRAACKGAISGRVAGRLRAGRQRVSRQREPGQSIQTLVGIGGSATNDGGFGVARALGWRFHDRRGLAIERWTELDRLVRLVPPAANETGLGLDQWGSDCNEGEGRLPVEGEGHGEGGRGGLVVAVDVSNPLLGPQGASRVYGPQKGLRREDFRRAEKCLGRLAEVVRDMSGTDYAATPGAGAAGGLGFGLRAFAGARIEPGFDLFADYAGLEAKLREAELVITGEGSIDRSTLMGKGVGLVAAHCASLNIPCVGLAGMVAPEAKRAPTFTAVRALTDLTSSPDAMARAAYWLGRLAAALAREF